jgi:voltage-gated potassium channel
MASFDSAGPEGSARARTYEVIFGHDTPAGKAFDVLLILAIVGSIATVMLDSVQGWQDDHARLLRSLEWVFTALFTVEYGLRLWCVDRPRAYALSFFGVIDLAAVSPTYLALLVPGGQVLAVVRILRVMRVFRVLKLARYMGEASVLAGALRAARYKISVFLLGVLSTVVIVGAVMYMVEGPAAGFTSIPRGVYWAVVTLTTVGYGDIAPSSPLGQAVASLVMILGYGIIAVPTGIVTAELTAARMRAGDETSVCKQCGHISSDSAAAFCSRCAAPFQ